MSAIPYPGTELQHPLRTVIWERVDLPGAEWCAVESSPDGWRMAGTVLAAVTGVPVAVRYSIELSNEWVTREVDIAQTIGTARENRLRLTVDGAGRWQIDRKMGSDDPNPVDERSDLTGLIDIDLGFSPATNTLPIRRLMPEVGEAVEVTAVWVRFPELTVEPLPQRYLRLGEHRYRYESAGGAFVAALEVDDLALVTTYEGAWRRTATADALAG